MKKEEIEKAAQNYSNTIIYSDEYGRYDVIKSFKNWSRMAH